MNDDVILKVTNLKQHFRTGVGKYKIYNKAVDGVSFSIKRGEVFSLVGESGCGKTTIGRTILKIYKPTDGEVYLQGKRIVAGYLGLRLENKELKKDLKNYLKDLKMDSSLSKEEIKEKYVQKQLETKTKIKANKKEIKQRKIDQNSKYRPSKEAVEKVKAESDQKIKDLKLLIQEETKDFLEFKANAFKETDSLPANTSDKVKKEIHDKEIKAYRERRALKENRIKTYNDEIVHQSMIPKFYNRPLLNQIQMVFQDPIDSLNPRMSVKDIIAESLYINGIKNKKVVLDKVYEVLNLVGLQANHISHYPHGVSGGQRQRIGVARAIIAEPKLIIADEPISALDVSIQAQIINLLNELREELGLTIMFIAHDLSVVKFLSDKVAIMYYGKIVEMGTKDKIFNRPLHPYTLSLISSIPMPDPNYEKERGPNIRYNPRQHDYRFDKPSLREIEPEHFIYANDKEFEEYKKRLNE